MASSVPAWLASTLRSGGRRWRLPIWVYRTKAAVALSDGRRAIGDRFIFAVPVNGVAAVIGDGAPLFVAGRIGMARRRTEK